MFNGTIKMNDIFNDFIRLPSKIGQRHSSTEAIIVGELNYV